MLLNKPLFRQLSLRNKMIIHKKSISTTSMYVMNPLPGLDIGIPLTIFQNTYTSLHFGENIITMWKNYLMIFLKI